MPTVVADLCIKPRWLMSVSGHVEWLQDFALVVHEGRILDVLPCETLAEHYAPRLTLERPSHLLMPGLIDAAFAPAPLPHTVESAGPRSDNDPLTRARTRVAAALMSGVTCIGALGSQPRETLRALDEIGLRALVALPVSHHSNDGEGLTRALSLRDEYLGHPLIVTSFGVDSADSFDDATLLRLATLAAELDAGLVMPLHESQRAVRRCIERFGTRPIERLHAQGLLSPAFLAVGTTHLTEHDLQIAAASGIAVVATPRADLRENSALTRFDRLNAHDLRVGLGSGTGPQSCDPWFDIKLAAIADSETRALRAATRGGAAALGLHAETGSLEPGKWADLCCLDLDLPAALARGATPAHLSEVGGASLMSDVWVAGRHLVERHQFTRLEWASLSSAAFGDFP